MREGWVLGILVALIAAVLILGPAPAVRLGSLWEGRMPVPDRDLLIENEALKAELAELEELRKHLPDRMPAGSLPVFIYSRYPLNFKNELIVSAGENDGVKEGMIAVLPGRSGDSVLVGRVAQVFPETSLVLTLFDPRFQTAVRVGERTEALFSGGSEPKATLIPKKDEVKEGDVVSAAGAGFPYALAIGEVARMLPASDQLFQEAAVRLPYDSNELRSLILLPQVK